MNQNSPKPNKTIGILAFLFVLLFAGLMFVSFSPWDTEEFPHSQIEGTASQNGDLPSGPSDGGDPEMVALEEGMPVLNLVLESGTVKIMLRPDLAPNHVSRIIELSESGFYDGIVFHRVIDGFMAQTGDPTGTGMGGSELPDLEAEINDRSFERGALGMARSQSLDSANSQFFIMLNDYFSLNGQYTLFGKVIEGMDLVDGIRKGAGNNGEVSNPDRIVSMRLQRS